MAASRVQTVRKTSGDRDERDRFVRMGVGFPVDGHQFQAARVIHLRDEQFKLHFCGAFPGDALDGVLRNQRISPVNVPVPDRVCHAVPFPVVIGRSPFLRAGHYKAAPDIHLPAGKGPAGGIVFPLRAALQEGAAVIPVQGEADFGITALFVRSTFQRGAVLEIDRAGMPEGEFEGERILQVVIRDLTLLPADD